MGAIILIPLHFEIEIERLL